MIISTFLFLKYHIIELNEKWALLKNNLIFKCGVVLKNEKRFLYRIYNYIYYDVYIIIIFIGILFYENIQHPSVEIDYYLSRLFVYDILLKSRKYHNMSKLKNKLWA